ncbi:hypothetical protein Hte_001439 [Hypoxylon texense]
MALQETVIILRQLIPKLTEAHGNLSSMNKQELDKHITQIGHVLNLFPAALALARGLKDSTGIEHGAGWLEEEEKLVKEYEEAAKKQLEKNKKRPAGG